MARPLCCSRSPPTISGSRPAAPSRTARCTGRLRALCERLAASGRVLRLKGVVQLACDDEDGDGQLQAHGDSEQHQQSNGASEGVPRDEWVCIEGVEGSVCFRRMSRASLVASGCLGRVDSTADADGSAGADADVDDGRGGAALASTSSKLFVLGRQLAVGSLRRDFAACRVPHGFEFAADRELHFGRRLTAASTATAGLVPRPCAVVSELPGVIIARIGVLSDEERAEERFVALERLSPSVMGSAPAPASTPEAEDEDTAFCETVAAAVATTGDVADVAGRRLPVAVVGDGVYVRR